MARNHSKTSFKFDFSEIKENGKRFVPDTVEDMIKKSKDWGYLVFYDVVQSTPIDIGDLRKSLMVDFNNESFLYVKAVQEGKDSISENATTITFKDVATDGYLLITFSANMVYAHYQHEGISHHSGKELEYNEPGTGSHFITGPIEENVQELIRDLKLVLESR